MTDAYIDPGREAFEAFKAMPRDQPIHMLNLLRFRERAAYPEGHARAAMGLSGEAAYGYYGEESGPVFRRVGGTVIWRGRQEAMLIGPDDKQWDLMFIAAYPGAAAFLEMVTDPAYRVAVVNRQAAVITSRLIRCAPLPSRDGTFA